jgi:hypothetical protein
MYGLILMLPTVRLLTTTTTYIAPSTCKYIEVYIIGGSGGGGGGDAAGNSGGGAAGKTMLSYFPAGTYSYVQGSAGAAGTASNTGGNGTTTTFNGIPSGGGGGGQIATVALVSKSATSNSNVVAGAARLGMIPGDSGLRSIASGNGGTNMFGLNGRGANNTLGAVVGEIGTVIGGGGGAGQGSLSVGGAGVAGGCVVIEHY